MPPSRTSRHLWSSFALALLCVFSPFIAVFLVEGGVSSQLGLNMLLCLCGWIPGVIHALTLLFSRRGLRIDHKRKRTRTKDVQVPFTSGSKYVTIWLPKRVNKCKGRRKKSKKRSFVLPHGEIVTFSRTPSISTTSTSLLSSSGTKTTLYVPSEPGLGREMVAIAPDSNASKVHSADIWEQQRHAKHDLQPGSKPHRFVTPARRSLFTNLWTPADPGYPATGISMERWIRRTQPLEALEISSEP